MLKDATEVKERDRIAVLKFEVWTYHKFYNTWTLMDFSCDFYLFLVRTRALVEKQMKGWEQHTEKQA